MNVFEQRRNDREVPPDAHGSRAFIRREPAFERDADAAELLIDGVRIATPRNNLRTVADLVARLREDGEL